MKHAWSGKDEKRAEQIFSETYPAIYKHFQPFRKKLIQRDDQGAYFWELRACKYWSEFDNSKIIYPDIVQTPQFTFDKDNYFLANTLYLIPMSENWLVGLLNSKALFWFYQQISPKIRGGFVRYIAQYVEQIPIPQAAPKQQELIGKLVDYILFAKAALSEPSAVAGGSSVGNTGATAGENPSATADGSDRKAVNDSRDALMISYYEQIIDALCYELYLADEIHKAEKYFFAPLAAENLPAISEIKGNKLAELRRIFERLFDRQSVIRQNIFFLDTIESVRIIEGKA